jgi:transcriptional regulator with XRE-family HTH domain
MNCKAVVVEKLKDPKYARLYGAEKAKSALAATLIESRKKANLTQVELARKIGISQPYVARLEGGKANPTLGTIGSLLAVMGCRLTTNVECLTPEPELLADDPGNGKEGN